MQQFEFRVFRLPVWMIVLALSLALALGLALAVVAAGLFLVIFPAMLLVAAVAAIVGLLRNRRGRPRPPGVIDADYEVHDGREQRLPRSSDTSRDR